MDRIALIKIKELTASIASLFISISGKPGDEPSTLKQTNQEQEGRHYLYSQSRQSPSILDHMAMKKFTRYNHRRRRGLRQHHIIVLVLTTALCLLFTPTLSTVAATSQRQSDLLLRGTTTTTTSNNNNNNNNNGVIHTSHSKKPPPNFLRWRKTQAADIVDSSSSPPNNNTTISNDFNNNTGTFVNFNSFGLQIGPVPSQTTGGVDIGGGGGVSNDFDDNELSLLEEALRYALERHLNDTLQIIELESAPGFDSSAGGTFGFVQVDDVRFVELITEDNGVGSGNGGSGESIRSLQQSSSSMNVYITGGRAFYLYGPGGLFMSSIPTSQTLNSVIKESVEKKTADDVGGMLAGAIRESSVGSSSSDILNNVESVQVIEGLTLSPTASPVSPDLIQFTEATESPTPSPTKAVTSPPSKEPTDGPVTPPPVVQEIDQSIVVGSSTVTTTAATVATAQTTTGSTTQSSAIETITSSNQPTDGSVILPLPLEEIDQTIINNDNNDSGDNPNNSMSNDQDKDNDNEPVIVQINSNQDPNLDTLNQNSNENGSSKNIILAGSLTFLVALLAGAALFVQRRQRRRNKYGSGDDGGVRSARNGTSGGGSRKVPMAKLSDDDDNDFDFDGDLNGAAGAAAAGAGADSTKKSVSWAPFGKTIESENDTTTTSTTQVMDNRNPNHSHGGVEEEEEGNDIGKVETSFSGALQIIAPPTQSSHDLESQLQESSSNHQGGDGEDADYDKMLANAAALGGGTTLTRNNKGAHHHHENDNDSLQPVVDTSYGVDTIASIEDDYNHIDKDGSDKLTKEQPLGRQDSLNQRQQSIMSSRGIGELDVMIDLVDHGAVVEDVVYDDIEEAMKFAAAAAATTNGGNGVIGGSDGTTDDGFANDADDSDVGLNSIRESLFERIASSEEQQQPTSSSNNEKDLFMSDSFGSHDILNDINQAAAKKNSFRESSSPRPSIEFGNSSRIDLLELDTAQKKMSNQPKEDNSHDILDTINTVAKSTRLLNGDNNVIRSPSSIPTTRERSANLSSMNDPPGDVTLVSNDDDDDDSTNLFAELRTVGTYLAGEKKDETSSSYGATGPMCGTVEGNAILQSTKGALKKKWNRISSGSPLPFLDSTPVVSDNDDDEDSTDDDQNNISRPWKKKWDDPFASNARLVSPAFNSSNNHSDIEGSNYDPDSDWDVDDTTEADFGSSPEDAFETSPLPDGDSAPMRIW